MEPRGDGRNRQLNNTIPRGPAGRTRESAVNEHEVFASVVPICAATGGKEDN